MRKGLLLVLLASIPCCGQEVVEVPKSQSALALEPIEPNETPITLDQRTTNPTWVRWDRKFRKCIQRGYEVGKLGVDKPSALVEK